MKPILFFSFLLFSVSALAQEDSTSLPKPDSTVIQLHQDARLDWLIKKQAEINEATTREARRTDKGFRLMIISTTNRDEAIAAKSKVLKYFPDLKAYLWYQSPYFRVKAGNFKDRKDAETYQKRMTIYFPRGVFIMKDIIEVKPERGGESGDLNP